MLREARVGRLATADAGGRPLLVPVCFAFDGATLFSAVDDKPKRTRELRRLKNIAANPHVSLVVDVWDEDWSKLCWVIVEGDAEVLTTGAEFTRAIDRLVAKYPQYRAMGLDRAEGAVSDGARWRLLWVRSCRGVAPTPAQYPSRVKGHSMRHVSATESTLRRATGRSLAERATSLPRAVRTPAQRAVFDE